MREARIEILHIPPKAGCEVFRSESNGHDRRGQAIGQPRPRPFAAKPRRSGAAAQSLDRGGRVLSEDLDDVLYLCQPRSRGGRACNLSSWLGRHPSWV